MSRAASDRVRRVVQVEATDLNRLREIIKTAQQNHTPYPSRGEMRVAVGSEGEIYVGDAPSGAPISKVHHAVFAASREQRDQAYARTHMPGNTTYIDTLEVRGWCYSIRTAFGREYTLFAHFTGADYQVKLIEPELEGIFRAHDGHLYADGTICLSDMPGAGQRTLEEAYSKSVLWANGMDVVLAGHRFPFSVNNV